MLKRFCVLFIALAVFGECSVTTFPKTHTQPEWEAHVKDFIKLIDVQKLMGIAVNYISDPEVMNFVEFLLSPEFKKIIWEIEIMPEFREAYGYLKVKGYDFGFAFDFINNALNMPPFEPKTPLRNKKGISGVFEEMMAALPFEEMKKLFEDKLETSTEISELFKIINSEEYLSIIKRMSANPEFIEIKNILTLYGFKFDYICSFAKGIFGEHYQGIFCA
ncbi:uncharacterized protein LOC114242992 [Bombyx mandarina]|uniref:Uncharacterized protein LOC114242992 n=1 Tax=Bombyx mandarina TaxID=7092 RepID=A0A6J2JKU7_BOMMA|nr:uncharacterized protein LOC114242992 [Bombyx mandarina]